MWVKASSRYSRRSSRSTKHSSPISMMQMWGTERWLVWSIAYLSNSSHIVALTRRFRTLSRPMSILCKLKLKRLIANIGRASNRSNKIILKIETGKTGESRTWTERLSRPQTIYLNLSTTSTSSSRGTKPPTKNPAHKCQLKYRKWTQPKTPIELLSALLTPTSPRTSRESMTETVSKTKRYPKSDNT